MKCVILTSLAHQKLNNSQKKTKNKADATIGRPFLRWRF